MEGRRTLGEPSQRNLLPLSRSLSTGAGHEEGDVGISLKEVGDVRAAVSLIHNRVRKRPDFLKI